MGKLGHWIDLQEEVREGGEMIKPLVELIEAVTDVEEKAHEHVRSQDCEVMDDYSSHEDTFKAGARSQASLGLALKEAVEAIEATRNECAKFYQRYQKQIASSPLGGFVCDRELSSASRLANIRRILEKETSE